MAVAGEPMMILVLLPYSLSASTASLPQLRPPTHYSNSLLQLITPTHYSNLRRDYDEVRTDFESGVTPYMAPESDIEMDADALVRPTRHAASCHSTVQYCPLLTAHHSLLTTHCSLLPTLLIAHYSLLTALCSLLSPSHPLLAPSLPWHTPHPLGSAAAARRGG